MIGCAAFGGQLKYEMEASGERKVRQPPGRERFEGEREALEGYVNGNWEPWMLSYDVPDRQESETIERLRERAASVNACPFALGLHGKSNVSELLFDVEATVSRRHLFHVRRTLKP